MLAYLEGDSLSDHYGTTQLAGQGMHIWEDVDVLAHNKIHSTLTKMMHINNTNVNNTTNHFVISPFVGLLQVIDRKMICVKQV